MPESPRTSFNIGEIEGGTSVNSIPSSAHMKVDLRSESEAELAALEALLRDAVKAGIDEEMSAARERGMAGSANLLNLKINVLGVRPAGELPRIRRSWPPCWRPTTNSATVRAGSDPPPTPIFRSR